VTQRRLTDAMIGRIKPPQKGRLEIGDVIERGLVLRITERGTKTFCLYYYDVRGRHRRFTIGQSPEVTLAEARERARIARRQIAKGKDPLLEEKRTRKHTINAAADLFLERHVLRHNKERTAAETQRKFEGYILPAWDGRPIASIERRDVAELIQGIADNGAPVMADRVLATVSKFFNWALVQPEYIDLLKANPVVRGMSQASPRKRDRVLTLSEIREVWGVADEMAYPFGAFTKMLLLTGQRRSEVASMRWSEIDPEEATWRLPAIATKTGRAHEVPLSSAVLNLLPSLPEEGAYVFSTRGGNTPISGFSKAKQRIDNALPHLEAWRFHDLRRTFASHLEELEVPRVVIAALLNHAGSSVTDIYTRAELRRQKRLAVERLGERIGASRQPERHSAEIIRIHA